MIGESGLQPESPQTPATASPRKLDKGKERYFQTEPYQPDSQLVKSKTAITFPVGASFVPLSSSQPVCYSARNSTGLLRSDVVKAGRSNAVASPSNPSGSFEPSGAPHHSPAAASTLGVTVALEQTSLEGTPNRNPGKAEVYTRGKGKGGITAPSTAVAGILRSIHDRSGENGKKPRPRPYPVRNATRPITSHTTAEDHGPTGHLPGAGAIRQPSSVSGLTPAQPPISSPYNHTVGQAEISSAFFRGAFDTPLSFHVLAPFSLKRKLELSITVS